MKPTIIKIFGLVNFVISFLIALGGVVLFFQSLSYNSREAILFLIITVIGGCMVGYVALTFRNIDLVEKERMDDILDEMEF